MNGKAVMRFRIRTMIGIIAALAAVLALLKSFPVLALFVLGAYSALLLLSLEANQAERGGVRIRPAAMLARFAYYSLGSTLFWLMLLALLEKALVLRF